MRRPLLLCLALLLASAWVRAGSTASYALNLSLQVGDKLESVLATLNERGFHIVYSSALIRPEMELRTQPKSSRIDALLQEILAPWNLRAVRAANGDWLIARDEGAAAPAAPPATPATSTATESLETIDVTATRMELAVNSASEVTLGQQDVARMPHLADDAMRMLKVMPGVSGGDFSAALNIRGGSREESLLTIDGAEIHNGFHFRDLDGALSVLDTNLVEGIDFVTGGMTADVGDYMSGAVGLHTHRPSAEDEYRNVVGVSFVSAYGRSSGTYAGDRGWWLGSVRRGFLDMLTSRAVNANEQLTPRYTDVFASGGFDFSERTSLTGHLLFSDDDLRYVTDNDHTDSAGKGRSLHLWFTLDHAFSDDLRSRTLLSMATMKQSRDSSGEDQHRSGIVFSDNDFRFLDLRQDWSWSLGENQLPRWGFNIGDQRGDYDYSLQAAIFDPLLTPVTLSKDYGTQADFDLRKLGVYAAWRTRLAPRLTAEAGARWDQYRYHPGLEFNATSPRLNLVYAVSDAGELRAAWGVVHQPQSVNELQIEDDVQQFFAPERVTQWVLGYLQHFAHGFSARLDVYDKRYADLRARYENFMDPVQLIPEGGVDRIRVDAATARARGVELTLRRDAERGVAGWISLVLARADDFVDDAWRPRLWDQRQAVSFGTSWTGALWNVSIAGQWHSGTPATQLGVESITLPDGGDVLHATTGPINAERLDPYARLDLRVNRDVRLAGSRLSFYLEVTNLMDRKNPCCVNDYHAVEGRSGPVLVLDEGYWMPLLPSLGFQWEF
jgi:hypothetical protein